MENIDLAVDQIKRCIESSLWMYLGDDFKTEMFWELSKNVLDDIKRNTEVVLRESGV